MAKKASIKGEKRKYDRHFVMIPQSSGISSAGILMKIFFYVKNIF
jgi:hypothetical protein